MTLTNSSLRNRLFNHQKFSIIKRTNRWSLPIITRKKNKKWFLRKQHKKWSKAFRNTEIFRTLRQSWRRRNLMWCLAERTPILQLIRIKWWGHHYLRCLHQLRQHTIKIEHLRSLRKNQYIMKNVLHEKKSTNKLGFRPNLIKMREIIVMRWTGIGYLLPVWPHNSKSHNYSHKSYWSL